MIAFGSIIAFTQVAARATAPHWLNSFDHRLSSLLHAHPDRAGFLFWMNISQLGSPSVLEIVVFLGALPLLFFRQWALLAGWLISLLGVSVLDFSLKEWFKREGPRLPHPWVTEAGWSFPSGHAMAAVTVYGFLAYMLLLPVQKTSRRMIIVAAFVAVVLAIGFSRLYIGVHYFSDVLGGYLAACSWLTVCVTGCEIVRQREERSI